LADARDVTPNRPFKWTVRDFDMEKLHLDPNLSHYYRDWRGGLAFWLDSMFPDYATDMIEFSLDDIGCSVCKGGTWGLRTLLGNKVTEVVLNEAIKGICHLVIKPLVGYSPDTCKGIID
jgi:hypothetical protein